MSAFKSQRTHPAATTATAGNSYNAGEREGRSEKKKRKKRSVITQHMTQHPPLVCSHSSPVRPEDFLRWCAAVDAPSRMSIDARVAASKTSSTPSILSAEHSLYARAPICCATRSASARETKFCEFGLPSGGRRSDLHPTKMTGIVEPQIERTSSIHCNEGLGMGVCGHMTRACLNRDVVERVRGVNGECDEDDM